MKGSDTTDRKVPVVRPGPECSHRRSGAGRGLVQLQQVTSEASLVGVQSEAGGWETRGDWKVAPVTSVHSREPSPTILPGDRVWFLLLHEFLWEGQSRHLAGRILAVRVSEPR